MAAGLVVAVVGLWPGDGLAALVFIPIITYLVWNLVVLIPEVQMLWHPSPSARAARDALGLLALAAAPRLVWTISISLDEDASSRWIFVLLTASTTIVIASTVTVFALHRGRRGRVDHASTY